MLKQSLCMQSQGTVSGPICCKLGLPISGSRESQGSVLSKGIRQVKMQGGEFPSLAQVPG